MALHRKLSGADVHTPFRWVITNDTERQAVTTNPDGSTITADNGLRAKLFQIDTNTEYVCTAVSPVTFTAVSGGGGTSMTAAEIKTAYESNSDTNAYTDTEKTKLAGIEANATADQTGAEIVSAIDTELDSTDWKTGGSTTSPSYVLVTENYTVTTATRFSIDVSSTSTSTLTVTLPASPSDGDNLDFVNEGGDYSTCNLIIGRNSKKIGGLEEDLVVDEEWGQFSLIFQSDSWSVYQPETVGSSGTVIDNLTSTSATDALSANQGRELKALVDAGGGSSASNEFVASGSIPSAGLSVVLNNDGTVSVVTSTGTSDGVGAEVVFNSGDANYSSATYDSTNGKVIIAYIDASNSNYGTAIVGTVSGTSITFGVEVVFNSGSTYYVSSTFDSTNGKIIIAYRDRGNSNYGTAIVGTISGTSISFGTPIVFNSGISSYISSTFDSTNGKIVIAYQDYGNSNYGTAIVGTISGTSISFGTPIVFNSGSTYYVSSTFDSTNGKIVIAYKDEGNSNYGTAIVGTVSGTSISFGTPVVFNSGISSYISSTFDSTNGKIIIAYRDRGNTDYGTAIIGTISGTSISFGTPIVFNSGSTYYISSTYDSTNEKIIIAYKDEGNSNYGTAIVGTISGTSISFGTPVVFNSGISSYISSTFDSTNGKIVIAYQDCGNSSYGTAVVFTVGGIQSTAKDFIGFAQATAEDGDTIPVATAYQTDQFKSSLTRGTKYYIDSDGTLATSDTGYPVAGIALTDTKLIVGVE